MLGIRNLEREQLPLVGDRPDLLVAVPMIVEIDNVQCNVSEWDVSGFALDKPLSGLNSGDVRTAHVVLRISDIGGYDDQGRRIIRRA
jgi:hypothetical protein